MKTFALLLTFYGGPAEIDVRTLDHGLSGVECIEALLLRARTFQDGGVLSCELMEDEL